MKNRNSGIDLWEYALKIIPGGNGLLSKRPDRYLPEIWPTYFSKCNGVKVTDLDGNEYIDMAQMAVGSAILGYSYPELVKAVNEASNNGVNCTLNSVEEVRLAEKLLELNPFAGGVKFARTGAEAMSIAIRISRAYSKKEKIAFSGYHGWSDWYLAANLKGTENLNEHLLPGLNPIGVPSALRNTIVPFIYNDVKDFLRVVEENKDIGVISIEGARYDFPSKKFLETIMSVAKDRNIILVSDEITSGWRMTDGGVYKINGFKPDIVVYGKALGGGYAISAVLGKSYIMELAQESFISSTMWTESLGFVAGLKTIEILCRTKGWERLVNMGEKLGQSWLNLANKHELDLTITDFKPLITFKLHYGIKNDLIMTLFIQEMLKRGYLASNSVYLSLAHNNEIIDKYLENVDEVFKIIALAIRQNNIENLLQTKVRSDAFLRLTR